MGGRFWGYEKFSTLLFHHSSQEKQTTNESTVYSSLIAQKTKQPTNLPYIHPSSQKIQQNKNIKLTFYPFFFPFNNSYSNTNLNSHPDYIKIVKKEVTSLPVTVVSVNIDLTPVVVVMLVVNTITVHYLISFTQVISVKLVWDTTISNVINNIAQSQM